MPAFRQGGHATEGRSRGRRDEDWTGRILKQGTDLGLLAALFAVPAAMGGRSALGELVLIAAATWTALAWAAHQLLARQARWSWTGGEILLAAGAGLGVLQIVSLPESVLTFLSPKVAEILPFWSQSAGSGLPEAGWTRLSLSPAASEAGLAVFVSYALLFLVAAQRVRTLEDIERVLRWIALASVAMATFGLVQYLTSNGKFFWVFEHPFSHTSDVVKGSFANRNHFASFLAMGAAPLLWWLMTTLRGSERREKRPSSGFGGSGRSSSGRELQTGLLLCAIVVVAATCLLSQSRGGSLALFLSTLLLVVVLYFRGLASGRVVAGLGAAGVLSAGLLLVYGMDDISNRLSAWDSVGRLQIWKANLEMQGDYPLVGMGIGSHVDGHPMYISLDLDEKEFTHAESSYIQLGTEVGYIGLGLAVAGVALCLFWCLRGLARSSSSRQTMAAAAILAALCGNFLHAIFDFVWYIPGCMVPLTLLGACAATAVRLNGREQQREESPSAAPGPLLRLAATASLASVLVLGGWMLQRAVPAAAAEPHWNEYLRTSIELNKPEALEPDVERAAFERQTRAILAAADADPNSARIQIRAAQASLRLFERLQVESDNAIPLHQIREAAVSSGFDSPEALREWLERAVGEHRVLLDRALAHTREGLRLCPLEGQGYLMLSELAFLDDPGVELEGVCLDQALIVRPREAFAQFAAGRRELLEGRPAEAVEYWQAAFRRDRYYQQRIIELIADRVPAASLIETFEPDITALDTMAAHYVAHERPDELLIVQQHLALALVKSAQGAERDQAVREWLRAHSLYVALERPDLAQKCLEAAVGLAPDSYDVHSRLGRWLCDQGNFAAAEEHLSWCLARRPLDAEIRQLAESAADGRLRGQTPGDGGVRQVSASPEADGPPFQ